jgi:hypothetical protein
MTTHPPTREWLRAAAATSGGTRRRSSLDDQLRADAPAAFVPVPRGLRRGVREAIALAPRGSMAGPAVIGGARRRFAGHALAAAAVLALSIIGSMYIAPAGGVRGGGAESAGDGRNLSRLIREAWRERADRHGRFELNDPLAAEARSLASDARELARLALAILPAMPRAVEAPGPPDPVEQ